MLTEPWLLLYAADLAVHATTHAITVVATAVEHRAHAFLEEITNATGGPGTGPPYVDGGCSDPGP